MSMNGAYIVKVALVLAIVCLAYKMFAGRRGGGGDLPGWQFPSERYENADSDDEASDAEEDSDAEDSDAEEDSDNEDSDSDAEEGDSDAEDDDADFEDEDEEVMGYDAADVGMGWSSGGAGAPLQNVSADLLPKPVPTKDDFSEFAPKGLMMGQNFLDAQKFIGINTQGSSLRNASHDLRSTPLIPKRAVGPWGESSIDPDLYRKPLE